MCGSPCSLVPIAFFLSPSPNQTTASIFSLRKEKQGQAEAIRSVDSVPPVPPIPAKYGLPAVKQNNRRNITAPPPIAKGRPDTGRSYSGRILDPIESPSTAPRRFAPLITPYSNEAGLPKPPSKVTFGRSTKSSNLSPHQPNVTTAAPRKFTPLMTPYSDEQGLPQAPAFLFSNQSDTSSEDSEQALRWLESRAPAPAEFTSYSTDRDLRMSLAAFPAPERGLYVTNPSVSMDSQFDSTPNPSVVPDAAEIFKNTFPEPTTFGIANKVLEAYYADHPAIIHYRQIIDEDAEVTADDEQVYPPGIPVSEYRKLQAQFEAQTLDPEDFTCPPKSFKAEIKKPWCLPKSSSTHSLTTTIPSAYGEHEISQSTPLDPPSPYFNQAAAASTSSFKYKSMVAKMTNREAAPLSATGVTQAKSTLKPPPSIQRSSFQDKDNDRTPSALSSSYNSSLGTSSLGRHGGRGGRLKLKKSLKDLFKRSASSSTPEQPAIDHAVPVPQPGADPDVPPLPETVRFKKPPGPPPMRPERPTEAVDLDLVAMRGKGLTRIGFLGGKHVDMGITTNEGKKYEWFSHERYEVERSVDGMVLHDTVFDREHSVPDI